MTVQSDGPAVETQLIAALADTARRNLPDGTMPPPFRQPAEPSRPPGRIRSWALPALAAAVVVALAVGALVLTHRSPERTPPAATSTPGSVVTLRSRTPLSATDLRAARRILLDRARVLGAQGGEVRIVGSDEIVLTLSGVAPDNVGDDLGARYALEFRPVLIDTLPFSARSAPAPSSSSAGSRPAADPWRSLGFAPPKDVAAFEALSGAQQGAVRTVVKDWDCGNAPSEQQDVPIIACDQAHTAKYLLGAAIVASDQTGAATAVAPDAQSGRYGWGVVATLTPAGQRQWAAYTGEHNEVKHPTDQANVVADVLDGVVIQASTIEEQISGATEIVTGLGQDGAKRLAGFLTAGVLPAPLDVVSVKPN